MSKEKKASQQTEEKKSPKHIALQKLAVEINEVLTLDPPIAIEQSEKNLEDQIKDSLTDKEDGLRASDKEVLSPFALKCIEKLGIKLPSDDKKETYSDKKIAEQKQQKQASPPAKKDASENKKEQPSAPPKEKKKRTPPVSRMTEDSKAARKLMEEMISKKKFTMNQIVIEVLTKYPKMKAISVASMLVCGRNPKLNKFSKLVLESEQGIVSFK